MGNQPNYRLEHPVVLFFLVFSNSFKFVINAQNKSHRVNS